MRPTPARRRAGFTLVELIVAMSLAIVVTALAVAVLNTGVIDSQRVISSADKVSGWLITAKNRAKRDGRPRGVRFFRSQTDPNLLTEAQYIETPNPWTPNPDATIGRGRIVFVYEVDTTGTPAPRSASTVGTVVNRAAYFVSNDATDLSTFDTMVQNKQLKPGDLLYLPEFGAFKLRGVSGQTTPPPLQPLSSFPNVTAFVPGTDPRAEFPQARISPQSPSGSNNARLLLLMSYPDLGAASSNTTAALTNPPPASYTTYAYSFQQSPRPLFGEPVLQLSPEAVIDARARSGSGPPTTAAVPSTSLNVNTIGDYDVLFAPSGQVVGQTVGTVAFLVRDPNKTTNDPFTDFDNAGQMAIVAVSTKTGNVATHPALPGTDPFRAAKDGINAGF
jgi:Tfp pilus assembly protein FimT